MPRIAFAGVIFVGTRSAFTTLADDKKKKKPIQVYVQKRNKRGMKIETKNEAVRERAIKRTPGESGREGRHETLRRSYNNNNNSVRLRRVTPYALL